MESLKDYFENTRGIGVMATADKEGKVKFLVVFQIETVLPLIGAEEVGDL